MEALRMIEEYAYANELDNTEKVNKIRSVLYVLGENSSSVQYEYEEET